jgi:hypothetical protein
MTDRRLRSVPEQRTPTIIDPPEQHSDDWRAGWSACRAQLENEWQAWYRRGLEATPVKAPAISGAVVGLGLCALSGFIVGFVLAVAVFVA